MIENISVAELKNLKGIRLIDIRSIEKYNNSHIPESINIPMQQLLVYPAEYLNPYEKYYIYCQKGIQSRKLCQILKASGYNVVNIVGGYETWLLNE